MMPPPSVFVRIIVSIAKDVSRKNRVITISSIRKLIKSFLLKKLCCFLKRIESEIVAKSRTHKSLYHLLLGNENL